MSWCPVCRTEYREGYDYCTECKSTLVEKLEEVKRENQSYDHEVFLTSVSDRIEADILEALLNSNNIPVLRKYREAGDYLSIYMGNTNLGVDIYVPSKTYEDAKDLLESKSEIEDKDDENKMENDREFYDLSKKIQRKRVLRARIILLFLVPGIFLIILLILLEIIYK